MFRSTPLPQSEDSPFHPRSPYAALKCAAHWYTVNYREAYAIFASSRDWGFTGDYVEVMWMMLQQEKLDDYVVATEESHTVEEFLEVAFRYVQLNWKDHVVINKRYFRPTEVDNLKGESSKTRKVLGWKPKVGFEQLVKMMVDGDIELAKREKVLVDAGYMDAQQQP
ncbi:GDP-mannose 4,6 dehydratase 1 [Hibiscus syriacus]|uniref:GDP-mannose 4,6-dehydratase n=1 Tax=Hibiscus syriacus TaxID=106335 RepID=A0A6A3BI59_HIBSY|nr:GDP-mannose 4,6 dehydratase 1 [Hibiscus syriacus]